jgi:ATP-dependent Clp protease protease subunit
LQIEEDTDRDRYMSPLEAKAYGLIDHIVGGDEAVFKVDGSTSAFPKTKEQYVNWGDEDFMDGSRGSRLVHRRLHAARWRGGNFEA